MTVTVLVSCEPLVGFSPRVKAPRQEGVVTLRNAAQKSALLGLTAAGAGNMLADLVVPQPGETFSPVLFVRASPRTRFCRKRICQRVEGSVLPLSIEKKNPKYGREKQLLTSRHCVGFLTSGPGPGE